MVALHTVHPSSARGLSALQYVAAMADRKRRNSFKLHQILHLEHAGGSTCGKFNVTPFLETIASHEMLRMTTSMPLAISCL